MPDILLVEDKDSLRRVLYLNEASLSEMALAALREPSWPGNVRELESDYR